MNILILSGAADTAGQGFRIVQAFRKHAPDWNVRSMAKDRQFMAYEQDLPFRRKQLEELYQACDVIHVRNRFDLYDQLAAKYGPKPIVLHVHGTLYRGDPNRFIREARDRGAVVACSTLDLWLLNPTESVWMPAPYDVDALEAMT